jgi:hypothetical protein
MSTTTLTFLLALTLLVAFFGLMGVRMLFLKGGKFRGTCASQSPFAQKEDGCSFCGRGPGETCKNEAA